MELLASKASLYMADIGTGKTPVAIEVVKTLQASDTIQRVLVVSTPRIIYNTWPDAIRDWAPELSYVHVHAPKRGETYESLMLDEHDFYLTTFDTAKRILDNMPDDIDMLIVDESHHLKGFQTQRFKAFKKWHRTFKRTLFLSGAPMPNSLQDLWSQAYLLDSGAALGKFITHYRNDYFHPHPSGFGWIPNDGAEEDIFNAMSHLVVRREATKEAGLPEIVHNDIYVTLDAETMRHYKAMENDFLLRIRDRTITAANAAGASSKVRQICNGFVYDEHGGTNVLHMAKLDALLELRNSLLGQNMLVAHAFKADTEALSSMFQGEYESMTGLSGVRGKTLQDRWNAGDVPILGIHPQSCGEGLNLQHGGHHLVWFGLPWASGGYWQTIGRLARSGQPHTVFVHRILVRGSIEERMARVLEDKTANQKAMLDAMRDIKLSRR